MALEHTGYTLPLQPDSSIKKEASSNPEEKAWYTKDVTMISPEARQLLESYSRIPPDQVIPHVLNLVRTASCPQPSFLPLNPLPHNSYQQIPPTPAR